MLSWQSPRFFAYLSGHVSDAMIHADLLTGIFTNPQFNYSSCPSNGELENLMMDWTVHALGLPEKFYRTEQGGAAIISSASEGIFLAVHAAKTLKLKELGVDISSPKCLNLVGYVSSTAHLCQFRALFLKDIHHRR